MPQFAIVRDIPTSFRDCITASTNTIPIDVDLAKKQHSEYCTTLSKLGLKLIRIEADEALPDCCFTEDTVIVLDELAIICNPVMRERVAETLEMEKTIGPYKKLYRVTSPGHIDGGDVVRIGKRLFIGASSRTNINGIRQVEKIVNPCGYEVIRVPIHNTLHLKSVCTYIGHGYILLAPNHLDEEIFSSYNIIPVPEAETYCADSLNVYGTVLIPDGYPKTKKLIMEKGFRVLTLDTTEIKKADGALTCLSVIF